MKKVIVPSHIHEAKISLPSSKSLSHRALICAALADGASVIHSLSESEDIQATISLLQHAGARFEQKGKDLIVHGISHMDYDGSLLDCSESGSTLRFLIPLFSLQEQAAVFTGHGRLMARPQSVYADLYHHQGLIFEQKAEQIIVQGPLHSGTYSIRGDVSSQFISGLLFALPLLDEDSDLAILPPFESASYVGLTIQALQRSGIRIDQCGLHLHIPGKQKYHPIDCTVAGDDSQMAFFAEAALIQHVPLNLLNLDHASRQGDHVIIPLAEKMGGTVTEIPGGYHICGQADKAAPMIDLADCPDLGPALFAMASQCQGKTVFTHCARLRMKESDRIACMEEEMRKLGCEISSDEDTVTVIGRTEVTGNCTIHGHQDHRIVMALAILAMIADGPVTIEGAEAVRKSYPDFFIDLAETGGIIHD
jgi:3-phosphoshikimate 1-carboxyvinyltransferase